VNPSTLADVLRPRGNLGARPLQRFDAASATETAFGFPVYSLSRLNHVAIVLAVYASWVGSPSSHARLAPGWWPAFAVQDSHLLGSLRKVSANPYVIASPFPRLCLAQPNSELQAEAAFHVLHARLAQQALRG
jgi:hypothetical protein